MEEKVISIIAKVLNVPTSDITPDTEIGEPDEWDSLHNLTIFTELEDFQCEDNTGDDDGS